MVFVFDASPYGLGAVAYHYGTPIAYNCDRVTEDEFAIWNHGLGQAEGQQTWEALVLLVAMKAWTKIWGRCRFTLASKGAILQC